VPSVPLNDVGHGHGREFSLHGHGRIIRQQATGNRKKKVGSRKQKAESRKQQTTGLSPGFGGLLVLLPVACCLLPICLLPICLFSPAPVPPVSPCRGPRPPADCGQNDRASDHREDTGPLAEKQKHPYRIGDRLDHSCQGGLGRRHVIQSPNEEGIGDRDLKNSHQNENDGRARGQPEVIADEGKHHQRRQYVPIGHRGLGRAPSVPAQGQNEGGEEQARQQSHAVPGHSAWFELLHEEQRHSGHGHNDGDHVLTAHRFAQNQGREQEDPDHTGVLKKDRVRGRGELRGDHEGCQAADVAQDGDKERRSPPKPRTEDRGQNDGRDERAVESDLQRRIRNAFDSDATRGPQKSGQEDQQNSVATGVSGGGVQGGKDISGAPLSVARCPLRVDRGGSAIARVIPSVERDLGGGLTREITRWKEIHGERPPPRSLARRSG